MLHLSIEKTSLTLNTSVGISVVRKLKREITLRTPYLVVQERLVKRSQTSRGPARGVRGNPKSHEKAQNLSNRASRSALWPIIAFRWN
ncbi:hypothetical protein KM043_009952 [Ampulex compressa]|nr:hypothetical protein KM043_009952 [Ampulex compressa]